MFVSGSVYDDIGLFGVEHALDRLVVANVGEGDGEITTLASESLTKLEQSVLVYIESDELPGLTFGGLLYKLRADGAGRARDQDCTPTEESPRDGGVERDRVTS